jgi:hypothetical protein
MANQHDLRTSLGSVLRTEIQKLLDGGQAHATFDDAVKDLPVDLRGVVPGHLPYSAWQLVEHMRIAQRDILDFSSATDGSYKPLEWPESYWPKSPEPPDPQAWDNAVRHIRADRKEFEKLLKAADDAELVAPFSWGEGQTLLREAFLIADHNAYHTGELILLRRLLGSWK